MKKFVFVTGEELSNFVEALYLERGEKVTAETSFNEEEEKDVVVVTSEDSSEEIFVCDLQNELSEHFGHAITHYDEMEVGDFGVGFLFFF